MWRWHLQMIPFSAIPNGVISQDGVVFSDRRKGRRGRRHKGLTTKLSDGKYPFSTSEKEENDSGKSRNGQNSLGDGGMHYLYNLSIIVVIMFCFLPWGPFYFAISSYCTKSTSEKEENDFGQSKKWTKLPWRWRLRIKTGAISRSDDHPKINPASIVILGVE